MMVWSVTTPIHLMIFPTQFSPRWTKINNLQKLNAASTQTRALLYEYLLNFQKRHTFLFASIHLLMAGTEEPVRSPKARIASLITTMVLIFKKQNLVVVQKSCLGAAM